MLLIILMKFQKGHKAPHIELIACITIRILNYLLILINKIDIN
ncbi:hypothetical protein O185_12550 [Photorhabdus temperata J3]|uniref:Uncharacterized protein n=1 Tax=Photorhabdus temperata J3 TaxID=1389415 RepID=U7QXU4_PHOTE|nr:hypothetical protein O185_12550 [Photorhabdus temperata J3]